jgi:DNA-binding NarL/FixJ family response regulator
MKTAKQSKIKNQKSKITPPLRIVLVDDHVMFSDVLCRQFSEDPAFDVVATADTTAAALAAVSKQKPDVVLLDIELGGESGLDAIGKIRALHPGIRIVMVSMFDHPVYRHRAFELGADAYATKGSRFEDLRALLLDGDPLSVRQTGSPNIWPCSMSGRMPQLTLSARELQVVRALAQGQQEKEAADDLGISVSSVGTYLKRAMFKTGVKTRAELFRCAAALGLETEKEP